MSTNDNNNEPSNKGEDTNTNANANKKPIFSVSTTNQKDFEVPKGDEGYVRKYDPEYNGPRKRTPYPSQKHRCDDYLEDVFYNFHEDRKLFWKSMSALWGCFRAEKGKEPPRTRTEKWEI
eukprot:TRINITY_DN16707_c0_g1_i2.p1 TRINITY_DN16707_c0_g1~~TRINITY_DN16707_c0_g1_i2.p1  ORF type:complete len:120 (+),score=25.84 TRINITY_DN16707_c0_g1_i2:102-461(+)